MAPSPPLPGILKTTPRPNLAVVILGHVDAGKSTLTGHLLHHASQYATDTNPTHAAPSPSRTINYAWPLDEDEQEREHGITMDVACKFLQTPHNDLVLQDAPGHADYVPAAISGVAAAHAALITVSVTDFSSSFYHGGQLREHAMLARGLGISTLLVALNKMDMVDWSKDVYNHIIKSLE